MTTKSKTQCLDTLPLKHNSYSYWNIYNAILLFNPIAGESVINFVIRREELLRRGTFDDDILLSLVSDIKDKYTRCITAIAMLTVLMVHFSSGCCSNTQAW